ncbi:ABC transporter ATP-binding protein [Thermoflavimicrobium daqui]|uniref:ABC transporter ATP-binding protein n=1 Tax=Thermoflavimicrobium daqui TaxID=2137476 RepID=A0A364K5A1_9BACL|nr:ABC transporter ATP-binding protein [Thermoflavimicrobium daqui]RAL24461.1 hypothetical protein DL897_09080 [Thermoflavimicrobium daqui]
MNITQTNKFANNQKEPTAKTGISILQLIFFQRKYILISLGFMIISVLLNLTSPLFMKQMIDTAIPEKNWSLLVGLIIGLISIPIFVTLFTFLGDKYNHRIGAYVTDQLRKKMFYKLTHFSPKTYNHLKSGDIAGRMYSCGEVGDLYITQFVVPGILHGLMFIGITGIMIYLNWKLTIISLVILPIMFFLSKKPAMSIRNISQNVMQLQQELSSYTTELVQGLKTVQTLNQVQKENDYQYKWIDNYRIERTKAFIVGSFSELLNKGQQALGIGVLFGYGSYEIFQGNLSIGSLVAFVAYFSQLFGSLEKAQFGLVKGIELKPKLEMIKEILDVNDEQDFETTSPTPLKIKGEIKFQNVSFAYDGDRGQVNNINLHIKPGHLIGIVGPSGGGKSTILDLLLGFYTPDSGSIFLDQYNLKEIPLKELRSKMTLVSQDVFLWNKSIKDNLQYANPDASIQDLEKACYEAQILDFIQQLPQGWDTVVGERGVKISGGEKQRLAIARALLRNPQIILMDEPTSALDSKTEAHLQEHLERIFKGKTVIIVAHRLATIRNADSILVIKDGEVAEVGTHEELLERKGIYDQLYREQFQAN